MHEKAVQFYSQVITKINVTPLDVLLLCSNIDCVSILGFITRQFKNNIYFFIAVDLTRNTNKCVNDTFIKKLAQFPEVISPHTLFYSHQK